ncbi:MAG: type II toxin-antitoxin system RelE family toxin [Acidimicrobiales bacterium]
MNRHLDRLPAKVRDAALTALRGPIAENPHRFDRPFVGGLAGPFSARRGEYRIIYSIDELAKLVLVHQVEHSASAYRRRLTRLYTRLYGRDGSHRGSVKDATRGWP